MTTTDDQRRARGLIGGEVIVHTVERGIRKCDGMVADTSLYYVQTPKRYCDVCKSLLGGLDGAAPFAEMRDALVTAEGNVSRRDDQ